MGRKSKYKNYDRQSLDIAVKEVNDGTLNPNKASKKYKIPINTLRNNLKPKGIQKIHNKRGRKSCLKPDEETKMVEWIKYCQKIGYPRTKKDLMETASKIRNLRDEGTSATFKNDLPSSHWVKKFLERNPSVSTRTAEPLSIGSGNLKESVIRDWFSEVYQYLEQLNLLDVLTRPEIIVNLTEIGFEYNATRKTVLAKKGSKNVYKINSYRGKETITATFAFSADGTTLPTQIIFKETFSKDFDAAMQIEVLDANFLMATSSSGWQNKELFESYIKKLIIFMEKKKIAKPYLFFYDSHKNYHGYELFSYCAERDVHIITFPSNATFLMQPCDVGIFGPLKKKYREEADKYRCINNNDMDEIDFIRVLKTSIDNAINEDLIKSSFKSTGLFPFDIEKVHYDRLIAHSEAPKENEIIETHSSLNNHENSSVEQSNPASNEDNIAIDSRLSHQNEIPTCYRYLLNADKNHSAREVENMLATNEESSLKDLHSEISQLLSKMIQDTERLNKLLEQNGEPKSTLFNLNIIHQSLTFLNQKYNLEQNVNDYSLNENPTSTAEENSLNDNSSTSIDEILNIPETCKKKATRAKSYKRVRTGVMTSEEVLSSMNAEYKNLKQADEERIKKKEENEERKLMNIRLLNIKKEKSCD